MTNTPSMQIRAFACLLAFTFLVFSCKKKDPVSSIDTSVIIEMAETLDSVEPGDRKLQLLCETEQQYGCYNYSIGYQFARQLNAFNIQFTHIHKPEICLTAIGPARATIDLGMLGNGIYQLNIFGRGIATGTLTVTDEWYKIDLPPNAKGVQLEYDQLNKIPPHTIWGGIGYPKPGDSTIAQQFINELKLLGALELHPLPGNYREFKVDGNGNVVIDGSGYWFHRPFLLHYGGANEPLKNLLKSYGQSYPDIYISIRNDKGQFFHSW